MQELHISISLLWNWCYMIWTVLSPTIAISLSLYLAFRLLLFLFDVLVKVRLG